MEYLSSFKKLEQYIEKENYKGYDPYDTLLGWFPFKWFGKFGQVIAIQFQKRNPFNIRPILGIKKEYNPKAMGLFLQAYSILYQKTNINKYKKKADFLFNWLINNYSKRYSGKCWGYNFPWASPVKYLGPFIPSSVVTGFVCKGLYEYYKIHPIQKVKDTIQSATDFINNDLAWVSDDTGICISYTPVMKDVCYNASLLAAEVLAINYYLNNNEEDAKNAIKAVEFVISQQKSNGQWAYSQNESGVERNQIDFHQGYLLESIFKIKSYLEKSLDVPNVNLKEKWLLWDKALMKGCQYYKEQQFFKNGRSLWRVPKIFPTEIHNQSQGIITFRLLKEMCPQNSEFSKVILDWTIQNMQDKKGCFYYQKFKFHTNKISYMRWSQAWMFLALSHLIKEK